ncbi:GNAT family N-acetyltransferase [Paraglaciecola aquimarina]|uniref:GNAT family N-acetyltransferase n=1 Tax=Paraglaciecola aquimarina TaxID=1235557 RepID=A0ABU3T250_9ALTE|nr:GNAT family N-acetyltransferase [Paraglaciecola aquimarina]MDU0356350.1 GNAT family N-acetyltransferase [Paraglaciecola aquimarina]
MEKNIKIQIETLTSKQQIQDSWNYIDSHAEENFFLSWDWIAAWLEATLDKFDVFVCTATLSDKPIGMAIFAEVQGTRHRLLKSKQWWLHKTGDEKYDQIWIEHNDFLLDKNHAEAARHAMWCEIIKQKNDIDEFILGMTTTDTLSAHKTCLPNFLRWNVIESKGWQTQLTEWPDFDHYWQTRSKNFKSQIKRSDKLLKALNVEVCINTDNDSFQAGLQLAKPWHIQHWGAESGFENELFTQHFHSVGKSSAQGKRQNLLTLVMKIDNKPVAVCLGFYNATTLYFYLSAQENIDDNRIKIGLYMHHQAIKWCFQNNLTCYDFLAGDYRYKRSFANKSTMYYLAHFQRNKFKFQVENKLRILKNKIRQLSMAGS